MENINWIDPCRICKSEVCSIIDHLRATKQVKSVREAARLLSEQLEGEITSQSLRRLYQEKKQELAQNGPQRKLRESFAKPDKCKGVSDLNELVNEGLKYSTIYADPPWPYSNQATRSATGGFYRSMSIEELSALPVPELASDNAHLHLWTTNAFLHEAVHLIDAWEFKYKSCLVWIKPTIGIGNYWRVSHEFLLLGVRGNLTFADHSLRSWVEAKRTRHSAKPEIIRSYIEKASPPEYLELFGRHLIRGWTVFGNQIEKGMFDEL